jgi:hypothetical protein
MGWGFRRGINIGPFRINMSKSGFGYSIGGRGFRVGKDARGRSYTAASIPGTGIFYRSYKKLVPKTPTKVYTSAAQRNTPSIQSRFSGHVLARAVVFGFAAIMIYFLLSFWRFRGQTELALWENRTTLRFKGEFALPAIDNDLFSRPSFLSS